MFPDEIVKGRVLRREVGLFKHDRNFWSIYLTCVFLACDRFERY